MVLLSQETSMLTMKTSMFNNKTYKAYIVYVNVNKPNKVFSLLSLFDIYFLFLTSIFSKKLQSISSPFDNNKLTLAGGTLNSSQTYL